MAASASEDAWAQPPDFNNLNKYGWNWDAAFTTDENYLDLAYLIARNSTAKDGHMGCVLVRGISAGGGSVRSSDAVGELVLCTINSSLFGAHRSDCHAEANAVALCAQRGERMRGSSGLTLRQRRSPSWCRGISDSRASSVTDPGRFMNHENPQ